MERRFKIKGRGQVINVLIEMWKAETGYQKSISNRRWRRSARWLEDYKIKFLEEYRGRNPFFKTSEDQTEESATGTREPNYVSGTIENSRNTTDTQNNTRRDIRRQDTPRPRRYQQKQQQPWNMQRQGDNGNGRATQNDLPHKCEIMNLITSNHRPQENNEITTEKDNPLTTQKDRYKEDHRNNPSTLNKMTTMIIFWNKLRAQRR